MSLLIILSASAIAGIAIAGRIAFVDYPDSAIDATRKELFDLRDEHFELARSGVVAFDNPGYLASRALINGMIRYAHDASLMHLLSANLLTGPQAKRVRSAMNRQWTHEMSALPKAAKVPVKSIVHRASASMVRLVVMRSIALSSLFAIGAIFYSLYEMPRRLKNRSAQKTNPAVACVAEEREDRRNVEEAMEEAIAHGPMRSIPRLIQREARRYGGFYKSAEDYSMLRAA